MRLSQCLIVKNEEKNIERALTWGKGIMSEQIVVDTGSTDRTVELAERQGARVYHFDWIDDFSAAKNYAIEKAAGDWIAFLDADEYIPAEEVHNLPEILEDMEQEQSDCCALLCDWLQLDDSGTVFDRGTQTRIFRNMPGLRYEGRIHETLLLNGGKKHVMDVRGYLTILHTGYSREGKKHGGKELRNRQMILNELSVQPDNYDMMGYMGDTYLSENNPVEAEVWYRKAIELMPDRLDEFDLRSSMTFTSLIQLLIDRDEKEAVIRELYGLAVGHLACEPDFDYMMGKYYAEQGDYGRGMRHLERGIGLLEQCGSVNKGGAISDNLLEVWKLLASCYYHNKRFADCVSCCVDALKKDQYEEELLVLLLLCFQEERGVTVDKVSAFLGKLYDFTSLRDLKFMRRAAVRAGNQSFAEQIGQLLSDNEKIRISQCMIVKNEEKNIEKALSWGKGIVWEQIVVDTGSTDRTIELAEKMGAKVYCFEWVDDFSAAKNFAIEKANGDWIAFLDADEYFTAEETKKILPLVDHYHYTNVNVMISSWMNVDDDGHIFCGGVQARLFRNMPGLRYQGRIHESLVLYGKPEVSAVDLSENLTIIHTGYGKKASGEGRKGARNREIILKELSDHPDDYEMMGNLGDALLAEGNKEEAEAWFYKAIALMPERLDNMDIRSSMTITKLMGILVNKGDKEKLTVLYDLAVKRLPHEADFDYYMGLFYTVRNEYEKGAYHLQRAINLLEQYGSLNKAMAVSGNLMEIWQMLAICYYRTGELSPCVQCCVTVLKVEKYAKAALLILLQAFMEDEKKIHPAGQRAANVDEVASFLDKLYDFSTLKDRIFLLRAAEETGYREMVGLVRGTFTQEELDYLDQTAGKRS